VAVRDSVGRSVRCKVKQHVYEYSREGIIKKDSFVVWMQNIRETAEGNITQHTFFRCKFWSSIMREEIRQEVLRMFGPWKA
jgi:hypothetical protein